MKKYKQKRKLISVICNYCKCTFEKPESEYNRNITLDRRNYCSRNCTGKSVKVLNPNRIIFDLSPYYGNRKDEFTEYKYYLKIVRNRFKEYNITLEDLRNQWILQEGICPYSGIKLELSTHTKKSYDPLLIASLDRIDSSKGYIVGNIQFVSKSINFMKGELTHEDTIRLCKIIAFNYK